MWLWPSSAVNPMEAAPRTDSSAAHGGGKVLCRLRDPATEPLKVYGPPGSRVCRDADPGGVPVGDEPGDLSDLRDDGRAKIAVDLVLHRRPGRFDSLCPREGVGAPACVRRWTPPLDGSTVELQEGEERPAAPRNPTAAKWPIAQLGWSELLGSSPLSANEVPEPGPIRH